MSISLAIIYGIMAISMVSLTISTIKTSKEAEAALKSADCLEQLLHGYAAVSIGMYEAYTKASKENKPQTIHFEVELDGKGNTTIKQIKQDEQH